MLAALLLYVTDPFAPKWRSGRSLAATFPIPVRFELDHKVHDTKIVRERDGSYRGLANTLYRIEIHGVGGHTFRFSRDGLAESVKFLRDGDRLYFLHRGCTLAVRDLTLAAPVSAAASGGDGKVRAAMNGRVVAVLVKAGEQVTAGQPVMTLEAMKMEHVHTAGVSGKVFSMDVAEGEQVTTARSWWRSRRRYSGVTTVIASVAKQSIGSEGSMDCFRLSLATTAEKSSLCSSQ